MERDAGLGDTGFRWTKRSSRNPPPVIAAVLGAMLLVALGATIFGHVASDGDGHPPPASHLDINPATEPPARSLTLLLGHPATLDAVLAVAADLQEQDGTVTITPTRVTQPATVESAPQVNTVVQLTVCAGSAPVTPSTLFEDSLVVTEVDDPEGTLADPHGTSTSLSVELQPGQCTAGTEGFDVPNGGAVNQVRFGGALQTQHATWDV